MSSIGLIGHSPHSNPHHGFLPIGLTIAALVMVTLGSLLWYGFGWLVNAEEIFQNYRDAERARPPARVAPEEVDSNSRKA